MKEQSTDAGAVKRRKGEWRESQTPCGPDGGGAFAQIKRGESAISIDLRPRVPQHSWGLRDGEGVARASHLSSRQGRFFNWM